MILKVLKGDFRLYCRIRLGFENRIAENCHPVPLGASVANIIDCVPPFIQYIASAMQLNDLEEQTNKVRKQLSSH